MNTAITNSAQIKNFFKGAASSAATGILVALAPLVFLTSFAAIDAPSAEARQCNTQCHGNQCYTQCF